MFKTDALLAKKFVFALFECLFWEMLDMVVRGLNFIKLTIEEALKRFLYGLSSMLCSGKKF